MREQAVTHEDISDVVARKVAQEKQITHVSVIDSVTRFIVEKRLAGVPDSEILDELRDDFGRYSDALKGRAKVMIRAAGGRDG